jgi:hypothetical protein
MKHGKDRETKGLKGGKEVRETGNYINRMYSSSIIGA